jgi:hypothetical protein
MRNLKVISLAAGAGLLLALWALGLMPVFSTNWKIWASVALVGALAAAALLAPPNEEPTLPPEAASTGSPASTA